MLPAALTSGDIAQVASAFFTELAAFAAFATVYRVERQRWTQTVPDLHIEVLVDMPNQQVRLAVFNYGGPAREVRVLGVIGDFGFMGLVGPTSYWRPGESRRVVLAMPPIGQDEVQAFVEGRDMGKRQLVVGTVGGATHRWPLRKAKKLSAAKQWNLLFPGTRGPLDVPHTPVAMQTIERNF
jgi:hypothetical protein